MAHEKDSVIGLPDDIIESLNEVSHRLISFKTNEFIGPELGLPSEYLLGRKSKLIRPTLVLMGAYLIGEKPSRFVDLAVACELLHASSLIHDDIIDGDRIRRGVQAVHVKYGNRVAVLAGDALMSKALILSSKYGYKVIDSLAKATMEMCLGEILDYNEQKGRKAPALKEYVRLASLKSASLTGACFSAAALCTSSKAAEAMYKSGVEFGIAFQIRDDIMDFIQEVKTGREKRLVPNAVTSIQKDFGCGRSEALSKAVKLNNKYVETAKRRLSATKVGRAFSSYADLIKVPI